MARDATWRRGTAALEFALVAPVLVALATGCVGLVQLVRVDMDLSQSAQTMAQLIANQTTITPAQMTDFCAGAFDTMTPYVTTGLTISVASVTHGGGGIGTDWNDTSCGSGTAIASPGTLAASLLPGTGDSAIVAQASYTYHNPLALVLPALFSLSATAYARPRGNATIVHN
ncbi:MAG: pilus assembly protein [Rhodospirillales bacterium]|nr:pilus assembly protein [Rhodospirillales bacterium]